MSSITTDPRDCVGSEIAPGAETGEHGTHGSEYVSGLLTCQPHVLLQDVGNEAGRNGLVVMEGDHYSRPSLHGPQPSSDDQREVGQVGTT